jgi:hypothetical protein
MAGISTDMHGSRAQLYIAFAWHVVAYTRPWVCFSAPEKIRGSSKNLKLDTVQSCTGGSSIRFMLGIMSAALRVVTVS